MRQEGADERDQEQRPSFAGKTRQDRRHRLADHARATSPRDQQLPQARGRGLVAPRAGAAERLPLGSWSTPIDHGRAGKVGRFPVFVSSRDSEEMKKYQDIEKMEHALERVDVENGEYLAWDRQSRAVKLRVREGMAGAEVVQRILSRSV